MYSLSLVTNILIIMFVLFQRRGNESCEWAVLSNDSEWVCHDGVDLTLCFQDTAILCTILFLFCFFGSLRLVCGHGNNRPGVPFNLINVAKIVSLNHANMK